MENALLELSAGGILAVLVIRSVLDYLGKFPNRMPPTNGAAHMQQTVEELGHKFTNVDVLEQAKQVATLYNLHDCMDSEGVPVWYVRSSFEKALLKLSDNVEQLVEELRANQRASTDVSQRLSSLEAQAGEH